MLRSPFHPGHFLRELLDEHAITPDKLARHIRVPLAAIEAVCEQTQPITPLLVVGLSGAFGTTPEFWLNLQNAYDLNRIKRAPRIRPLVRVA